MRRPLFQFHLSTAIVLMFVAACLLISLAVVSELLLRRFFPRDARAAESQKPQT